jgi:hypothetical protein
MAGKMRAKKFRRPKSGHQGEVMTVRRRRAADCLDFGNNARTLAETQLRYIDTDQEDMAPWF